MTSIMTSINKDGNYYFSITSFVLFFLPPALSWLLMMTTDQNSDTKLITYMDADLSLKRASHFICSLEIDLCTSLTRIKNKRSLSREKNACFATL